MALELNPLSNAVGAEVRGLDLHKPIDSETAGELRAAFLKHHLLLVRDPNVSEDEQARFGEVFGEIKIRHRYANVGEQKKTQYVSNSRSDGILGDGEIHYHQDHTFYEKPLSAIILYGVEVPKSGSATKFRKSGSIYDKLPGEMRDKAEGVKCLHLYNYLGDYTKWQDPSKAPADSPRAWQPLVWVNPKSGEKALWAIPISTVAFEGIPDEDGKALIEDIWNFAAENDGDCTYVHNWLPGDLLIWDNLMLQHARLPFASNEPRTLRRTPIV
jgi:alpha-ketoglutarate-dependent taurine dioxygenase